MQSLTFNDRLMFARAWKKHHKTQMVCRFSKELMQHIIPLVSEDAQLSKNQADLLGGMLGNMGYVFCEESWSMKDRLALEVATYINSCNR